MVGRENDEGGGKRRQKRRPKAATESDRGKIKKERGDVGLVPTCNAPIRAFHSFFFFFRRGELPSLPSLKGVKSPLCPKNLGFYT